MSDVPSVVTPFRQRKAPMFQITIGASIKSAFREEFMIKGLVPHQGFGVLSALRKASSPSSLSTWPIASR
jgi:hypothetical protein